MFATERQFLQQRSFAHSASLQRSLDLALVCNVRVPKCVRTSSVTSSSHAVRHSLSSGSTGPRGNLPLVPSRYPSPDRSGSFPRCFSMPCICGVLVLLIPLIQIISRLISFSYFNSAGSVYFTFAVTPRSWAAHGLLFYLRDFSPASADALILSL